MTKRKFPGTESGHTDAHEPLLVVFTGSFTPRSLNLPVSAGTLTPSEGTALVILGRMGMGDAQRLD